MLLSSLVSPPFSVSHYLLLFIISSLLTLSVQFSFPLSWVPFVSFTFNNHLYRSFPSVSSLFFLPHSLSLSLSATKDDASDKTDGKIISLCFTSYNLLVLFLFFFLFFFPSLHSSPPLHVSSLQLVATVPPAVSLMFNTRLYRHPTQHTMNQSNDTSKIIFCFTTVLF